MGQDLMKFKCIALLGLVTLLYVTNSLAASTKCLKYHDEITISGKLTRQTFAEQPNYESIKNGDRQVSYFFISPNVPLCVAAGMDNEEELAENNVKILELAFMGDKDMFGPLRSSIGKFVSCIGDLFHAINGHHHSRILLATSNCTAVDEK